MLSDKFDRKFHYLRMSITDVCNFRCNYCLPDGYKNRGGPSFLNPLEIQHLVNAFAKAGTGKIRITGGEPILRKELFDIIANTKQTVGINKVALTTNGYRLPEVAKNLKDAGLDQLNVSVDSLDPQVFRTITGHDRLNEILRGIEQAANAGIREIKVNAVLMKGLNDKDLQQFLGWIRHQPITLRFIEVMQTGDNSEFFNRHHLPGQEIKNQLLADGWVPVLRAKDAGPAQEFQHPDFAGRIGLIMPYSKDFCATCNRLRVSATGKLHMCLFGEQGFDLRPLLQHKDQQAELLDHIQNIVNDKKATHFLHQGGTGLTRDLSMLGG